MMTDSMEIQGDERRNIGDERMKIEKPGVDRPLLGPAKITTCSCKLDLNNKINILLP